MQTCRKVSKEQNSQRGITLFIVAAGLVVLLGIAALAIDLVSLYVARNEAQRTADGAALAGAKVFVETGFLSGTSTQASTVQSLASTRATNVATQNTVAGQTLQSSNITVTFNSDFSPQKSLITVQVQQTAPTFFAKAFGVTSKSVSASATAEAYSPRGGRVGGSTVGVMCLKPFFAPNCDPNHALPSNNTNCNAPIGTNIASFFTSGEEGGGRVANPGPYPQGIVGMTMTLDNQTTTPPPFLLLDEGGGSSGFTANVTTCNRSTFLCGTNTSIGGVHTVSVDASTTDSAVNTLIHASGDGLGQGQDSIDPVTLTITGGSNNPNPAFRGVTGISSSDSVVMIPIFENNPIGTPPTAIVGFLQVFITQVVSSGTDVQLTAVVLNAVGCGGGDDEEEEGCGGGDDEEEEGRRSCTTITGPGGMPFLIRLVRASSSNDSD